MEEARREEGEGEEEAEEAEVAREVEDEAALNGVTTASVPFIIVSSSIAPLCCCFLSCCSRARESFVVAVVCDASMNGRTTARVEVATG